MILWDTSSERNASTWTRVAGFWKVPFRECYADSFVAWVRWTLWCHVVLRVWPDARSRIV